MRMLGDKILVKCETKKSGTGLIDIDFLKKKESRGLVISMGDKCINGINVGDTVVFRGTGVDVSDEFGIDHIIISESKDVLFYQKKDGIQQD